MSFLDVDHDAVEARIDEILLRWDEARERGKDLTAVELCRDFPELAAEVERRIRALQHWNGLAETSITIAQQPTAVPPPASRSAVIYLHLDELEFHAQGGLGTIFKARDHRLERDLAVKFPGVSTDMFAANELQLRFLREVAVTAALEHPGIVPVHGLGQDAEGRICYAMRFVTGKTLQVAIAEHHAARRTRPLKSCQPLRRDAEFRSLLQRFKSACVTVAYAHSRGYLHRDLKPEHILLGDFDVTLVIDWGLTKPRSDIEATPHPSGRPDENHLGGELRTEIGIGTLGFASPEQQAGDWARVGPASDVFSLGATLYVLLTGRLPFPGTSVAQVMDRVERGDVVPPRKSHAAIPRALEAICLKAMDPRPEQRYPSAQALADDIERWLADDEVEAYPKSRPARAIHWMGRQKLVLFMLLAAAASGVGVATTDMQRQRLQAIEVRSLAYVSAEQTAREQVLTRRPGWTTAGLDQVARAKKIATPLRSDTTLRSLAASCLDGIDLRPRSKITAVAASCLAFSPDGRWLAVGEPGGEQACRVRIIDLKSSQPVHELTIPPQGDTEHCLGVSAVSFSPDGRCLTSGLRSGKVFLWELDQGPPRPRLLGQGPGPVIGLGFTSGARTLVCGWSEGQVVVWNLSTDGDGREFRSTQIGHTLTDLAISRDGSVAACAGAFGVIPLELEKFPEHVPAPRAAGTGKLAVRCVAISTDGQIQAAACDGFGTLTIGTEPSPQSMVDPDLGMAHRDGTSHIEFNPDGNLLASGSLDNTVKLWDVAGRRMLLRQPVFSESAVIPVFHPGGHMLAIGSSRGVVLHDLLGVDITTTRALAAGTVNDFVFLSSNQSADGPDMVTMRDGGCPAPERCGSLELWTASALEPVQSVALQLSRESWEQCLRLKAHPRRRQVILRLGRELRLIDFDSKPQQPECAPSSDHPEAICYARDGQTVWGIVKDDRILSWRLPDLSPRTTWKFAPPGGSRGRVAMANLAAGNKWVVAGTHLGQVLVLRSADGQLNHTALASGPIQVVTISPDESVVACGTQRGGLDLIRLADGKNTVHAAAHGEMVTDIDFHPSGRYLVTSSRDRQVILWRIGSSRLTELLRISHGSNRAASAIHFSPDGRYLGILVPMEQAVRIRHIGRLRKELRVLGLDWEDESDEPVPPTAHSDRPPQDGEGITDSWPLDRWPRCLW